MNQARQNRAKHFSRVALLLIIAFLIIGSGALIYLKVRPSKKPNIIIILIDSLRRDHMGIYGYGRETTPNIDRFARKAVVFQNAVSECSWTNPSVASLFSSLYPSVHGLLSYSKSEADSLNDKIVTLAEVLKGKGYATGAFVANRWVSRDLLFDQGFDNFDPISSKFKPLAPELNEKALSWILKNKEKPFFAYLHYMDVHQPYEPPEPFASSFRSAEARPMSEEEVKKFKNPYLKKEVDDLNYYRDQYDGEIRYTDYHIGKLLQRLEENKLLKNSIIVITADHGEAFFEHGFCYHGWSLYNEEINIPLIIKFPRRLTFKGNNVEKVGLRDIGPTIFHSVNGAFPYETNGKNLWDTSAETGAGGGAIFSEEHTKKKSGVPKIAMIRNNLKAIYIGDGVKELYDLKKDGGEKNNLLSARPGVAEELEKEIRSWRKERHRERKKLSLQKQPIAIEKGALKENLKALGYIQ